MPGQGDAAQLDWRALLAQVGHHYALGRRAQHRALEAIETAQADDRIDFGMALENFGTRLRETSGHNDPRVRIEPARAPRDPQTLAIGAIGNGAGIDDVDVGGLVEFAAHQAERAEARLDNRRIVL